MSVGKADQTTTAAADRNNRPGMSLIWTRGEREARAGVGVFGSVCAFVWCMCVCVCVCVCVATQRQVAGVSSQGRETGKYAALKEEEVFNSTQTDTFFSDTIRRPTDFSWPRILSG